ncbi:MAG: DUF4347 domain-containing protein, partial [Phormidesmis sp.]
MSQSIAFIDASLSQNDLALKDFDGQVYTIPFGEDGVQYISEVLSQHQNLDAVHLFSHGTEAALMLGNTVLNPETLQENAALLQSWQSALVPEADFLLYGCNVAAGETGEAFVKELSQLIGADVAASENLTGTAVSADWQLEASVGDIQTEVEMLTSESKEAFTLVTINEANPGSIRVVDNDGWPQDDEDDWSIYGPGSYDDRFDGDPDVDEFRGVPAAFVIRLDGKTYVGPDNFGGQGDDIGGGTIYVYWNVGSGSDTWYGSSDGARTDLYWNSGDYGSYYGIHVFGGNDTVYANGGNDLVYGGSGNDNLYGGSDNDTLRGESGDDTLEGNSGNDTLEGGTGNDTLKGGSGTDTLSGGEGNNIIYAGDSASADPDTGTHTITSGSGDDVIHGSQGKD